MAIDADTKWMEAWWVTSPSSACVIRCLQDAFARFGNPDVIMSDNGTAFVSAEFREFLAERGIKQLTIAPHCAWSNGAAERAVRTLKELLPRFDGTREQRLQAALEVVRYTPGADKASPAMRLLGWQPVTALHRMRPISEGRAPIPQPAETLTQAQDFQPGDQVWVRLFPTRKGLPRWKPAVVQEAVGNRVWWCCDQDNVKHKRHVSQMRRRSSAAPGNGHRRPMGELPTEEDDRPTATRTPRGGKGRNRLPVGEQEKQPLLLDCDLREILQRRRAREEALRQQRAEEALQQPSEPPAEQPQKPPHEQHQDAEPLGVVCQEVADLLDKDEEILELDTDDDVEAMGMDGPMEEAGGEPPLEAASQSPGEAPQGGHRAGQGKAATKKRRQRRKAVKARLEGEGVAYTPPPSAQRRAEARRQQRAQQAAGAGSEAEPKAGPSGMTTSRQPGTTTRRRLYSSSSDESEEEQRPQIRSMIVRPRGTLRRPARYAD